MAETLRAGGVAQGGDPEAKTLREQAFHHAAAQVPLPWCATGSRP
jgi:hypothetical protein